MNGGRFVGMWARRVLRRVGVDGELMRLAEKHCVAEFLADCFGVDAPALGWGVVVAVVLSGCAAWHVRAASGADGLLS